MKFYILFALFALAAAEPAMEQEWTAEYGKYGVDAVLPLTNPHLYYRGYPGYPGYLPTRAIVTPEALTRTIVTPEALTRAIVTPEALTRTIVTPEVLTRAIVTPEVKAYPHGFKATIDPELFNSMYGFYPPY